MAEHGKSLGATASQSLAEYPLGTPGSKDAQENGCICAVIDNYYGRGVPWPRDDGLDPEKHPSFWVSSNCPVHATNGSGAQAATPKNDSRGSRG